MLTGLTWAPEAEKSRGAMAELVDFLPAQMTGNVESDLHR